MSTELLRDSHVGRRVSPTILWSAAIVGVWFATSLSSAQSLTTCEDAQARVFDFWVGDWDIRQSILREDATFVTLPAKTSVSLVLDGCALVEYWEGHVQFFWEGMQEPEPMKAISVRAYDPRRSEWNIYWMDTRSRRFDTPYVGNFAGDRGDFYREWETPEGRSVGRIRFSHVLPDSVNWSLAVSSDGRQNWTTIWSMEMRRARR